MRQTISLPAASVGIGLRAAHYAAVFEAMPALDFVEVHAENFFHAGGAARGVLRRAAECYPVSLHGVGLALASMDPADDVRFSAHLARLAHLVSAVQPALVSEHLCWGAVDGVHFNDLLPFPYTAESLAWVVSRVLRVQDVLQRPLLIENLSAYVSFAQSELSECEFLAALVAQTGCQLLLDVNNLYVNACNFDFDPLREFAKLPRHAIAELHLAGHSEVEGLRIDTHSAPVCEEVWALYRQVYAQLAHQPPTLIEWDQDLPDLSVLLDEAARARREGPAHA